MKKINEKFGFKDFLFQIVVVDWRIRSYERCELQSLMPVNECPLGQDPGPQQLSRGQSLVLALPPPLGALNQSSLSHPQIPPSETASPVRFELCDHAASRRADWPSGIT